MKKEHNDRLERMRGKKGKIQTRRNVRRKFDCENHHTIKEKTRESCKRIGMAILGEDGGRGMGS